jgi:hypothetical protein
MAEMKKKIIQAWNKILRFFYRIFFSSGWKSPLIDAWKFELFGISHMIVEGYWWTSITLFNFTMNIMGRKDWKKAVIDSIIPIIKDIMWNYFSLQREFSKSSSFRFGMEMA